jgi:REase_DpnII-MboI
MAAWTKETATQELDRLMAAVQGLAREHSHSHQHMQWLMVTYKFLRDVFGEASLYFLNFAGIQWVYRGSMIVHVQETFTPGATEERYNRPVYVRGLEMALGVLSAARLELQRSELAEVYEGKDTGPEASLILKIMTLAESKLRKTLRKPPTKEREVQDAFENLLIGADVEYEREKDSIVYSSKTYVPDFTVARADLAVELKLATGPDHEKEFIAQINDDILAYGTKYGNLFFVVYDCGQIRDVDLFTSSLEAQGAVVRVVKH